MNGYKVFYKDQETEIMADTSYDAQQAGAKFFKARKPWDVTVRLCEKDGQQVTHTADF